MNIWLPAAGMLLELRTELVEKHVGAGRTAIAQGDQFVCPAGAEGVAGELGLNAQPVESVVDKRRAAAIETLAGQLRNVGVEIHVGVSARKFKARIGLRHGGR